MDDFSGADNVEIPTYLASPPMQQDAPMTKANKQVLLALVVLGVAFLVLCCL